MQGHTDLEQIKARDNAAENYVQSYFERGPTYISIDHEVMISYPEFKSTDQVLDAGCGVGYAACKVAPLVQHIEGIDFSSESIKILSKTLEQKKIKNINPVVGDLTQALPYANESFDKIISYQVLSYIDPVKLPLVFNEFYRVLKKGGTGYFTVFKFGFRGQFRHQKTDVVHGITRNAYTADEIEKLVRRAPFSDVKVTGFINSPAVVRNFSDQHALIRPWIVRADKMLTHFSLSRVTGHWLFVKFKKS